MVTVEGGSEAFSIASITSAGASDDGLRLHSGADSEVSGMS